MATGGRDIQCFEDVIAWQKARELTRLVFRLTGSQPLFARVTALPLIDNEVRSTLD